MGEGRGRGYETEEGKDRKGRREKMGEGGGRGWGRLGEGEEGEDGRGTRERTREEEGQRACHTLLVSSIRTMAPAMRKHSML